MSTYIEKLKERIETKFLEIVDLAFDKVIITLKQDMPNDVTPKRDPKNLIDAEEIENGTNTR